MKSPFFHMKCFTRTTVIPLHILWPIEGPFMKRNLPILLISQPWRELSYSNILWTYAIFSNPSKNSLPITRLRFSASSARSIADAQRFCFLLHNLYTGNVFISAHVRRLLLKISTAFQQNKVLHVFNRLPRTTWIDLPNYDRYRFHIKSFPDLTPAIKCNKYSPLHLLLSPWYSIASEFVRRRVGGYVGESEMKDVVLLIY